MGFNNEIRICTDCGTPMAKVSRMGITIDECPRDGVVVLDPGELEAIISHVSTQPKFRPNPAPAQQYYGGHGAYTDHTPVRRSHHRHHGGSSGGFGAFFGGSS